MGHVLITGPGRSGTSFLVQLLTGLGFDTGFENEFDRFNRRTYSGMEIHISEDPRHWQDLPKIVKDPELCFRLGTLMDSGFEVDHVIVPVRDLELAAKSREKRRVFWRNENWHKRCGTMERFLASALGSLVADLIIRDIPHTFLTFPEVVEDLNHIWDSLPWLFQREDLLVDQQRKCVVREAYDDVFKHLLNFAPRDSIR